MSITYAHADPSVAVDRAQAFARAYLEFRERALADAALDQAAELGRKLRAVRDQIELATRRFSVSLDDGRTTALDAYLASLRSAATEIQFELAALARLPVVGQIIQPASRATPSGPDRAVAGGAGLLVGLVLGLGYAGLRARRDDRIASVADLEATVGAPVLGRVPSSRMIGMRERRIAAPRASPKTIEAYRIVRANLAAAAQARGARSIVVTSASSGRGTATASVNLAVALTQAGNRIALIGSDTRRARLCSLLRVPRAPGLTDVLAGERSLAQTMVPLPGHGLRTDSFAVPPGTPVDDPAAILGSEPMTHVLSEILTQGIDFVLIDAPAILTFADAAAIVRLADAIVLIVDGHRVTHASLEAVLQQLEHVGGELLGVIVTGGR
jgi:capsular exopolysaccharide synthesis family protein